MTLVFLAFFFLFCRRICRICQHLKRVRRHYSQALYVVSGSLVTRIPSVPFSTDCTRLAKINPRKPTIGVPTPLIEQFTPWHWPDHVTPISDKQQRYTRTTIRKLFGSTCLLFISQKKVNFERHNFVQLVVWLEPKDLWQTIAVGLDFCFLSKFFPPHQSSYLKTLMTRGFHGMCRESERERYLDTVNHTHGWQAEETAFSSFAQNLPKKILSPPTQTFGEDKKTTIESVVTNSLCLHRW